MNMKQFFQPGNPFEDVSEQGCFLFFPFGTCRASWIAPDSYPAGSCAAVFELDFSLTCETELVLHVTADEHYEIMLDGERFGRGPISGPADYRYFDSYRGNVTGGSHRLQAIVYYWGRRWLDVNQQWRIPDFRMSSQMAFFLSSEGTNGIELDTGLAEWHCRMMPIERKPGGSVVPDCRLSPLQNLLAAPEMPVRKLDQARAFALANEYTRMPSLAPSPLPPMKQQVTIPHVKSGDSGLFQPLLDGENAAVLEPNREYLVILEFSNYVCTWLDVQASGGKDAVISMKWAEAAFLPDGTKGQRNTLEGREIIGFGDDFLLNGADNQAFCLPFWRCGRLLELRISMGAEPACLKKMTFTETHYPLENLSSFDCDDPRIAALAPLFLRSLEMCSHDTFMDCPYYERLQYTADTRQQALGTYAFARDDRLICQALRMTGLSRAVNCDLTLSRYPSEASQNIPTFSLWLICMAHDNAWWRGNRQLHVELLPRLREIADYFHRCLNEDGVVQSPYGWNFMDWCSGWTKGYPPSTEWRPSCLLSLIYELALGCISELENYAGQPELSALFKRWATELHGSILKVFHDETSGLFYDDQEHTSLSEHAQALAALTGRLTDGQLSKVRANLLNQAERLTTCTVSFSHYYFEAARVLRCPELFHRRMKLWYSFLDLGFATIPEQPEPCRSDCHGWGVHPYYHFLSSGLGIRPLDFAFKRVLVSPLELWPRMRGVLPHPDGVISVEYRPGHCEITLPPGIEGQFEMNGQRWGIPADGMKHDYEWQA